MNGLDVPYRGQRGWRDEERPLPPANRRAGPPGSRCFSVPLSSVRSPSSTLPLELKVSGVALTADLGWQVEHNSARGRAIRACGSPSSW